MHKKILVHAHIFYPELWGELREIIRNFGQNDLIFVYITIPYEIKFMEQFLRIDFPDAHIEVVENKGYDVAPFLHILKQVNLDDFDYVVKLHTKRNVDMGEYLDVYLVSRKRWRNYLLAPFKTKENFQRSISLLENDSQAGMVSDYHCILRFYHDHLNPLFIMKNFGTYTHLSKHYTFVAGTMFIAKASLLKEFQQLPYETDDFESPVKNSFQLAHYLERYLGYSVCKQGKKIIAYDSNAIKDKLIALKRCFLKVIKIKEGKTGNLYLDVNLNFRLPVGKRKRKNSIV